MTNPKFNISDTVYHIMPESPPGVVIDVIYSYSSQRFTYDVVFDVILVPLRYGEHELSTDKTF